TTALTITRDQIAGLGKGSTDLGNNAQRMGNAISAGHFRTVSGVISVVLMLRERVGLLQMPG
ncbi:hypothetical protein, partial [Photobacterium sp. R1]